MNKYTLIREQLPKGLKIVAITDSLGTKYTVSKTIRLADLYKDIVVELPAPEEISLVRKTRVPNIKTILQLVMPEDWQNYYEKGSTKCKMPSYDRERVVNIYNRFLKSKHDLKRPYVFLHKEEDFTQEVEDFFLILEDSFMVEGVLSFEGDEKLKAFLKETARKMHLELFKVKEELDKKYLRDLLRAKRTEKAENSYK